MEAPVEDWEVAPVEEMEVREEAEQVGDSAVVLEVDWEEVSKVEAKVEDLQVEDLQEVAD